MAVTCGIPYSRPCAPTNPRKRSSGKSHCISQRSRESRQRADSEKYADVAGQVNDTEDKALADLVVDVNNAEVTRDVEELRQIQSALERIATGDYGICIRCGAEIPRERLDVYPTAERCLSCQEY